ncbi:MAG: sulfurtransferase [SAR324 cluster bacterium]|nr:sulfurtransferase [SAR324 cluster bacterium]
MYQTFISTDELSQNYSHSDWVIVDCRFALNDTEQGRKSYREAHIPGALYAHLDEDLSSPIVPGKTGRHPLPDINVFAQTCGRWGIGEGVQVIVYDDSVGAIASRLWWMLRWLGHNQVAVLDGGWKHWQQEERPMTDQIPVPEARTFNAQARMERVADAQAVMQFLESPDFRIVDARSADRYRGENETIDPVAGHIPNALSMPFMGNVGADGLSLSPEDLKKRFRSSLGDVAADKTICYCGSGVTACHNLLAMNHAGIGDGVLYPGSWSEWITDLDRPIGQ